MIRFDADQAYRFLSAHIDRDYCVEIRILNATMTPKGTIVTPKTYPKTISGWFNDPDKAVKALRAVHETTCYVSVNPVDPKLLARSYNEFMIVKSEGATKKENIPFVRHVFIDIDPERPAGISSTDDELTSAIEVRDKILSDHPEIAANSVWGRSGNGCFIVIKLDDPPNTEETAADLNTLLAMLAEKYGKKGRDDVHIDATTKDASRIMCIPGTLKCKGSNIPERPWRLATIDGGC